MAPTSAQVLDIIAEITGYDAGTLLPDMELEADLGVDTVKQATILAKLGERFGVSADDGFRLADFLTIRSIIERFQSTPTVATTAVPPPPTAPSPQPAGPVGTLDLARDSVLRVIAEVTGYSADILTPDMELEADLGVDTVKQATIMAVLAEKAGFSPDDQFRMAEVPSIGHIIAKFGGVGSPVMAQPAAKSVNSIALVDADRRSPGSAEVAPIAPVRQHPAKKSDYHPPTPIEALVEILTLRTDYPPEMLTPELSLRGDLALDPEVIEDIRCRIVERFGLPPDWVLDADASLANLGCSLATLATSTSDQTPVDLARQVLVLRPTPIAASETKLKQQSIWVIGDHGKIVSAVQRSLAPLVRSCAAFALPKSGTDDIIAAFERFAGSSKADIVVDTTACGGKADIHTMRPKDAEALIERAADARFRIYKLLSKQKDLPCRILAVTAMDGCFGLGTDNSARLNPVFGLYRGFYKTLRKEWRKTAVSILDVRTSEIADRIASELAGDGPGVEVCYLDGVRHRIVLDDVAFGEPSASVNLDLSDVVVATGGGSGITAQIVRELARRAPSRFLLTGRFELPEDVARLASLSEAEWNDEKDRIRKRLAGTGSGVPPIAVERELAVLKRNAEIYRTVEALHAAGCEVRYRAVDARDRGGMSAVLNETRKAWGPITVLIHGAGIEISHSFFDKSADEFRQVHSVKTLGALHLGQLCRKDPLRAVVAFSSISARFGNAGQIDYTAANGFLDVWARDLGRCMGIHALSLAWSGWSEVGMAWRSSFVREMGEAAGVNLIDPQTGSQAAVREILAANGPTEVVLHRGLGFMNEPGLAEVDLARLPFIDWVEQTGGTVRTVHRRFSPKRDIILDQHRFGGAALMPGVGFIELLAEARTLFERPREGAFVFRGLEFSETLRFFREQGREVRVDVTPSPDFPGRYLMIAASPFRAVVATQTQLRRHCRAEVSIEPPDLEWVQRQNWEIKNVRQDSLKRVLASLQHLSYRVELGPLYNEMQRKGDDVEDVEVLWNNETICIPMPLPRLQIEHPGYARMQYVTNPAFLDSAHQTAAMFALLLTNEAFLPAGADEFVVLRAPNVPGTYRVIAKLKERSQDRTVYDIGMWNEQNELFAYIKRSAFKRVRQQL
jgi:NAD(P)-dependent dehydrogenase (short-subunit alcohol dehydrogenase family)/acyl carrier protein